LPSPEYLKWCKKALFKNGRKLQDDLSKDDTFVFIFEHAADPIAPSSPIYAFFQFYIPVTLFFTATLRRLL